MILARQLEQSCLNLTFKESFRVGKPRVQSMVPQAVYTRRDASLDGAWVPCRLQGKWPFHQEFAFAVFLSVRIYVYMSVCLACLSCLSVIRPHRKANGKHCKKITSSSRDRLELFDFPLRFDAIQIRAKTGSVTAPGRAYHWHAVSTKPAAATYKIPTNR